jgi:TRAP transporter TAXI family solute receptor
MKLSFKLSAALAALCLGGTIVDPGTATAQDAVRLGTSSTGSAFYSVAVGISKLIQSHAGVNVTVEPVGGSHANMFGLQRGNIELSIANSGATFDAYFGNDPFKKPIEVRIVVQGQPTFRGIFTRKGSGIKTAKDVEGKVFLAKRKPLPELEKLANAWLAVNKVDVSKVNMVSSRDLGEMNRVLRAGSADVASYPFAARQPMITKLFFDNVIEPVIFSDQEFDAILKRLPDMFSKFTVKANNFQNQPKAFPTFGLTTQLVTTAKTSEETVYKVAKAVLDNNKEFITYHKSAREWTAKQTATDPKIPFHPGTIRYLKEAKLWTADLEARQARLLSRK